MSMGSVYLNPFTEHGQHKEAIDGLIKVLDPHRDTFEAVAFRGLSGSIVAPAVAYMMGKGVIAVAKDTNRHGSCLVEGPCLSPYIIVDDFVGTGNTIDAIREAIRHESPRSPGPLIGIALYASDSIDMIRSVSRRFGVWVGTIRTGTFTDFVP